MRQEENLLIEDHAADGMRSGEGAAAELNDGTLMLVYSDFCGGGDFSAARLLIRRSADGARSWSEPELFFNPEPGWINVMSVSMLRLHDGRLAAVFAGKIERDVCVPFWTVSEDEGMSWSSPVRIVGNDGYYVVNNDRLVQLNSGRILLPYAFSPLAAGCGMPLCGCLISDDSGQSWRHGREEIRVRPENYRIPEHVVEDSTPPLRLFTCRNVCTQEPGVIELKDGRVLMWARSNGGYCYAAFSSDQGDSWTPFGVLCDTPMANGPATIKRIPASDRLVMLHNDRSGVAFGDPEFKWRTPLAVSISDDEGETWGRCEPLIGDTSHNYCYYSMCFFDDRCLITTYESADFVQENGEKVRRNLRSLRAIVVENIHFSV